MPGQQKTTTLTHKNVTLYLYSVATVRGQVVFIVATIFDDDGSPLMLDTYTHVADTMSNQNYCFVFFLFFFFIFCIFF